MKIRGRHIFIHILTAVFIVAISLAPLSALAAGPGDVSGDDANTTQANEHEEVGGLVKAGLNILALPVAGMMYILYVIIQRILNVAAWTFNLSIQAVVVGMADLINTNAGINIGWSVMRDIANTAILFSLIYIGFMTILRASGSGWKRMLGLIIVAAILVNFSMVIAKVVIDVSNVMAIQIFKSLSAGVDPDGTCSDNSSANDFAVDGCIDRGVSAVFLDMFSPDSIMAQFGDELEWYHGLEITYLMVVGVILSLIIAFVFFAGAFLLISRFIVLTILIVFSPLAFAAFAFPGMQGQWKKWSGKLIDQSFFAPAFLFMLWLSAKVMEAFYAAGAIDGSTASAVIPAADGAGIGLYASLTSQNVEYTRVFIFFALTAAFCIASLLVAKRMGAYGASTAVGWMNATRNRAWRFTRRQAMRPVYATGRGIRSAAQADARDAAGLVGRYERDEVPKKWYNAPTRAIASAAFAIPGVRRKAQDFSKYAQTKAKQVSDKNKNYSTAELNRQYRTGQFATSSTAAGVVSLAAGRGELNKLDQKLISFGLAEMARRGMDTKAVLRHAPHLAKDKNQLVEAIKSQKNEDIKQMNWDAVVAVDKQKEKDPKNTQNLIGSKEILEAMHENYKGYQAAELLNRGDNYAQLLYNDLHRIADSLGESNRHLEGVADVIKDEHNNSNLAMWLKTTPASNLLGLPRKEDLNKNKNPETPQEKADREKREHADTFMDTQLKQGL